MVHYVPMSILWQVLWILARDIAVLIGMGKHGFMKLFKMPCFTHAERESTTCN